MAATRITVEWGFGTVKEVWQLLKTEVRTHSQLKFAFLHTLKYS